MHTLCLLVVVFAVLALLVVPEEHGGPHRAHRLSASQKSQRCKVLYNSLHKNHHTLRHSHKCSQVFHSKYKSATLYNFHLGKKRREITKSTLQPGRSFISSIFLDSGKEVLCKNVLLVVSLFPLPSQL